MRNPPHHYRAHSSIALEKITNGKNQMANKPNTYCNLIFGICNLMRTIPQKFMIIIIELYQNTLSPDHGPLKHNHPFGFCRHEPTCSEYAKKVILKRGAIVGSLCSIWRIIRCNPFTKPDEKRLEAAAKRSCV